jgi:acetyl-CoA carboxylase biotin carboxyl carrier protein
MVEEINNLVKMAKKSGIKNFHFRGKGIKISFSFARDHEEIPQEVKENSKAVEENIEEVIQPQEVEVKSEFIGILSLDKKSNISQGVGVNKDQIIGHIESLGVKHEIKSPIDGKIKEILDDGAIVDYGKVICKIVP